MMCRFEEGLERRMDWLQWDALGKPLIDYAKLDQWLEDSKEESRSKLLALELDYCESRLKGKRRDIEDLKDENAKLREELAQALRQLQTLKGQDPTRDYPMRRYERP